MSPLMWALTAAVLFVGGVVKGGIGFALPVLVVPFLSLFIGPREAVLIMSVPVFLTNLANTRIGWHEWRKLVHILPYVIVAVLCVPVGVMFLYWVNPLVVRLVLGVVLYFYLAMQRMMPDITRLAPRTRVGLGAGFGLAGGFLAGMAAVPGPVNIVYFSMFAFPKDTFIFLMNFFNTVTSANLLATLAWRGSYTAAAFARIAIALVPIFLGFWVGLKLRPRIRQEVFYLVVRIALFLIATSLILRSAWELFL